MTTAKKIFRIKLPITLDEYRRGFRYTLAKFTTDEVIYQKFERSTEMDKITTKTHKTLNLTGRIPMLVKKVIPTAACFVEEFSTNVDTVVIEKEGAKFTHFHQRTQAGIGNKVVTKDLELDGLKNDSKEEVIKDEKVFVEDINNNVVDPNIGHFTETNYKNVHFDEKTFKMKMITHVCKNKDFKFDQYSADIVDLDFRVANNEDLTKIGDRDYSGNYEERFDCVYIFKYVEIELNSFGLGWISKELLKVLKSNLLEIQQCNMKWFNEWINLNDQEIEKKENEIVMKYSKL